MERWQSGFGRYAVELSGPDGGAIRVELKPEDYPFLADGEARIAASQLIHALSRAGEPANGATHGAGTDDDGATIERVK